MWFRIEEKTSVELVSNTKRKSYQIYPNPLRINLIRLLGFLIIFHLACILNSMSRITINTGSHNGVSFSETDIISEIRDLNSITHVKNFYNADQKWSKSSMQLKYMQETRKNGCVPKGILDQADFRLSTEEPVLQQKCQAIFVFAACRTLDFIIKNTTTKVEFLRQRKFSAQDVIFKTHNPLEQHLILTEANRRRQKLTGQISDTHQKKLRRDNVLCKVYIPWQDFLNQAQKGKARIRRLNKKRLRKPRKTKGKRRRKIVSKSKVRDNTTEDDATSYPPPVINLTSKLLSEGHFNLFKKGPNFVPTHFTADQTEFLRNLRKWENSLRWAYYHKYCRTTEDGIIIPEVTHDFKDVERTLIKSTTTYQSIKHH